MHIISFAVRCWVACSDLDFSVVAMVTPLHALDLYTSTAQKLDFGLARADASLRRVCRLKSPFVLRDKEASLVRRADDAQHAADRNDSKELYEIVRRLAGSPSKPLHTIKDESGEPLTSGDAVTSRWRRHFRQLFKARDAESLSQVCGSVRIDTRDDVDVSPSMRALGFRPSLQAVYDVLMSLDGNSGVGEDKLSANVLKAGGWCTASIIHAILEDVLHLRHVPIVWRGGRLVVLFKGMGSPAVPDNYRGIIVSDHLSKIITAFLL